MDTFFCGVVLSDGTWVIDRGGAAAVHVPQRQDAAWRIGIIGIARHGSREEKMS